MQIYLVGGAVRDALLGLPVKDRDWVLVGATPQQLLEQGYLPVGKDFPVFLDPHNKEQYALARTERKTAPGYLGFAIHAAPDVTLEQDLARRDLTINAIAIEASQLHEDGGFDPERAVLTDPYHGQRDLRQGILRHVADAFREDPVRILRVARFAARFPRFQVAPETMALMRGMVEHGEAAALVAERVWQEMARGLMEATPSRMFEVLQACGAERVVLPELQQGAVGPGPHVLRMLDLCATRALPLQVRFACLCLYAHPADIPVPHTGHGPIADLSERLRVPSDCRALAQLAARERTAVHESAPLQPGPLVRLLERCDAFRKPQRFAELLLVLECDAHAGDWPADRPYTPRTQLLAVLAAAQAVSTHEVALRAQADGKSGTQIGELVHAARVAAVARGWGPRSCPDLPCAADEAAASRP